MYRTDSPLPELLDLNHRNTAKAPECVAFGDAELPRYAVHDTQSSERLPLVDDERNASIESDVRRPSDQWIVRETLVQSGVLDNQRLTRRDHVGAETELTRRLGDIEADARLEDLTVAVDEAYQRDWNSADLRGKRHDVVEYLHRRRIEKPRALEHLLALSFIARDWRVQHKRQCTTVLSSPPVAEIAWGRIFPSLLAHDQFVIATPSSIVLAQSHIRGGPLTAPLES